MAFLVGSVAAAVSCGTPAEVADAGDTPADASAPDTVDAGLQDGAAAPDADARDATVPDVVGVDAADVDGAATASDTVADPDGGDGLDPDSDLDAGPDAEAEVDAEPPPSCTEGANCLPQVYVPPCFQGRCNDRGACVIVEKPNCCRSDADCPPDALATACQEARCVTQQCQLVSFPGCCADDPGACGSGACDPASGRCQACPAAACPDAAPLFAARFDDGVWPLATADFQAADGVTWQVDGRRSAAGGRAAYLGNARCLTYYGGALDGACQPTADGEQDSGRVQVQARTPWVELPAGAPAVASLWLWSDVEPSLGRGRGEPDVLRVWVEPGNGGPAWLVASSLDVGKSTGGAWRPLLVDLLAWEGEYVRLLFDFDTFDGEDNRHEGIWIDELVVARACADGGCCASDRDCPTRSPCAVGRCIGAAQGTGGVCVLGPIDPGAPCVLCDGDGACGDADPCTADRCVEGACRHDAFCCIEHDSLDVDVARDGLGPLLVQDDDPQDGVEWQVDAGAAWFGDPTTGTYAARPPPRAVGGALWTPTFALPAGDAPLALDLDLSLATEWDLEDAATFANPAGLDRLVVELVDGGFTTELWSSDELAGTTHGAVVPIRLDLAAWRGRAVQVHVRFASGDADANGFDGPRIYRLRAGTRCD